MRTREEILKAIEEHEERQKYYRSRCEKTRGDERSNCADREMWEFRIASALRWTLGEDPVESAQRDKQTIITALRLAAECLEDDMDADSHIGQFIWPGCAMNSNVTGDPQATEITSEVAYLAFTLMQEVWPKA